MTNWSLREKADMQRMGVAWPFPWGFRLSLLKQLASVGVYFTHLVICACINICLCVCGCVDGAKDYLSMGPVHIPP